MVPWISRPAGYFTCTALLSYCHVKLYELRSTGVAYSSTNSIALDIAMDLLSMELRAIRVCPLTAFVGGSVVALAAQLR